MKVIKEYCSFNPWRYSDPWVAIIARGGTLDFSKRVGGYTGALGKGDAGKLYISDK